MQEVELVLEKLKTLAVNVKMFFRGCEDFGSILETRLGWMCLLWGLSG